MVVYLSRVMGGWAGENACRTKQAEYNSAAGCNPAPQGRPSTTRPQDAILPHKAGRAQRAPPLGRRMQSCPTKAGPQDASLAHLRATHFLEHADHVGLVGVGEPIVDLAGALGIRYFYGPAGEGDG